jgi:lipid-A-disaccharide synthase
MDISINKKIMIVAGEASGDLHGGPLVQELKKRTPQCEIFGIGGDNMAAAGMKLYYHVNDLAYVGFTEVAKHYFYFRQVFYEMLDIIRTKKPDVLVLIDYPGFNLRLAKKAKKLGVKTFYYIAPQVWAWGQGRAKKMANYIDKMAVLFDFEVQFFSQYGISADFVGHPLLDSLKPNLTRETFFAKYQLDPNQPLLALLPGSRHQEIQNLLPVMLNSAIALQKKHPQLQVAISKAPNAHLTNIEELFPEQKSPTIIKETYDLLSFATAAIVASGTATLETALFEIPFVITYKVSPLTYFIGKQLIKLDYIGLVNVISGKKVVPEFIQNNANPNAIKGPLEKILFDQQTRNAQIKKLQNIRIKLGHGGASQKTAQLILKSID